MSNEVNAAALSVIESEAQRDRAASLLVRGPAGSGKTEFLAARTATLIKRRREGAILVTAFTVEGLARLRSRVESRLGPDDLRRCVFANLQPWAKTLLSPRLVGRRIASGRDVAAAWDGAFAEAGRLEFPRSFYREEWDRVVQVEGLDSRTAYVKAARKHRRQRLDRAQRLQVWDVLSRFQSRLDGAALMEWADLLREARLLFEEGHEKLPFVAAVCDEVQEFRPGELALLRSLVPPGSDDLTLAGDARQRLWGFAFDLRDAGIELDADVVDLSAPLVGDGVVARRAEGLIEGAGFDDLLGRPLVTGAAADCSIVRVTADALQEAQTWARPFGDDHRLFRVGNDPETALPLARARRESAAAVAVLDVDRLDAEVEAHPEDAATRAEAARRARAALYVAVTRAGRDFLLLASRVPTFLPR